MKRSMPIDEQKSTDELDFKDSAVILTLRGSLTIWRAAEIKDLFIRALSGSATILVDLDQIAEVDLTFIQLLHSAKLSAANLGKSLSVRKESQLLLKQMDAAGLTRAT